MSVQILLKCQEAGGVLENSALNTGSLDRYNDGNPDTAELIEASKALVLARRHFEETVQRLAIKYKV
jgi:hypothetical protein